MAGVDRSGLAVARGIALTLDDRVRATTIERLMCDLSLSYAELRQVFGSAAEPIIDEARLLAAEHSDGLIEASETGIALTPLGRPFVRSIAAVFDQYLQRGTARHSSAV
jgi:oxygen-independent coproporphyrinogen-3 oxidase